jgi:hypothetical protein
MNENQVAARQFIIEGCLRLTIGEEERFTRSVVTLAFPAEAAGRSSEDQILDELPGSLYGHYRCRRDVPTGDYVISRTMPEDEPVR